jgi:hypothetical protein
MNTPHSNGDPPPPCVCNNEHRNHRFFHRIRIRSTHLHISVNFQRVLRRFPGFSSRNQSFHAFWLTPPCEMPPKHRQLHAPWPKPAGNAYQSLVDLPEDGPNPTFDGRDGKVDGTDDNTVVIANPHDSGPPASQQLQHNDWVEDNIVLLGKQINFNGDDTAKRFIAMDNRLLSIKAAYLQHSDALNSKIDSLLQKMDAGWTENTALREAYHASREETAALRAAVDALTKRIDENITIPAPPSPDLMASSTTMEEMTMQLSVIQHDIQDVLEAIRNPPGKRKQHTSTQDTEPTTPMDR